MQKRMMVAALALTAMPAVAFGQSKDECMQKWLAAESAGIVYGVGMVGSVPTAEVDDETFQSIDFNTKAGMAETLNCAVVGPGKYLAEIQFLSHRTHKRLARWTPTGGLVVD